MKCLISCEFFKVIQRLLSFICMFVVYDILEAVLEAQITLIIQI